MMHRMYPDITDLESDPGPTRPTAIVITNKKFHQRKENPRDQREKISVSKTCLFCNIKVLMNRKDPLKSITDSIKVLQPGFII
jgi:hypothetical protein